MFSLTQCLEWCTLLPSPDGPRKSPVFIFQGNEWYFNFLYEKADSTWYFVVYLELHNKHTEIKETSVKFQVGFKNENNLSLKTGEFKVSKHIRVWCMNVNSFQSKLPSDYLDGNWIKFKFFFNDVDEAHLKIKKETEDETETSERLRSETSHLHLEALSKDFAKLLNDHLSSDVDVTCKDKTFKAHRIVLSARSEVLGKMLNSSMVEGTTGQIKVKDCQVPIFQSFLRYLYSGKVPGLSLESATQLYEVSDKYGVLDLRRACSDFLRNHLTDDKAYEVLILADQHSDEEFRKNVVSYMIDRKIPQRNSHWPDFCKNYCKLANEVMLLYIQKYCPK